MSRLRFLVSEIHRRSLWQVLGVYAFASWMIWQVVVSLYEGIGLPQWVPAAALVLLLLGLPLVLATAFVQEGAPGARGERGGASVEGLETTVRAVAEGRPLERRSDHGGDPRVEGADETGGESRVGGGTGGAAGGTGLLTWRRATTAGVLAFAGLGLATTGFMGMRALGIGPAATLVGTGALDAVDPVLLADFSNATSDSTLGTTVTGALRVDLERSTVLRLVSGERVRDALRRMERDPEMTLTRALAREIAQRDGYKAWIEGEVRELGGQFLLNASVVASSDGRVLASFRETAEGVGELIPAIDRLSGQIRGKVGESLRAIRSEEPLPDVTTASLGALTSWTEGMRVFDRKGDQLAAVRQMEFAIAEDSTFAMAWMALGILLDNLAIETDRQLAAVTKAFEYRERLPRRDRHFLEAVYYTDMGETERAIDAYEAVLALDSTSGFAAGALNNLALLYRTVRQHDRAAEAFGRAIRVYLASGWGASLPYSNYITQLTYAGRFDAARAALDSMAALYPDHRRTHSSRISWAGADGDYATLDSLAEEHLSRFGDAIEGRNRARTQLAYSAAIQGRLTEADSHLGELEREAASSGWAGRAAVQAASAALMRGIATQRYDEAVRRLDRAMERHRVRDLAPDNVPYQWLAYAYARLGDADRARALLRDWEREIPDARREAEGAQAAEAEALIALLEGRVDEAEVALETAARRNFCDFCRLPVLGMLRERQGRPEEAIHAYREFLETPWLHRSDDDAQEKAFCIQRLADLYEQQGDPARAALFHARLIEIWADADPELRPRVDAARRALARLTTDRGA